MTYKFQVTIIAIHDGNGTLQFPVTDSDSKVSRPRGALSSFTMLLGEEVGSGECSMVLADLRTKPGHFIGVGNSSLINDNQ